MVVFYREERNPPLSSLIYGIAIRRLVRKRCMRYLAHVFEDILASCLNIYFVMNFEGCLHKGELVLLLPRFLIQLLSLYHRAK